MTLRPCYDFKNSTNCILLLGNLPCSFVCEEKEISCKAEIVLDPDCSVDVKTEISLDLFEYFSFITNSSKIKSINLDGKRISSFVTHVAPSSPGKAIITFTPNEEPVPLLGCSETKLSKVIFHLFDFKDEIGTSRKTIQSGNGWYTLGVTELISSRWKVELHEMNKSIKEETKKNTAPSLSHVCSLSRADGSEFDGNAARQMMLDLRLFFTFCQGAFCPPVMPVGYDTDNNKVWALGISPEQHQKSPMSWFDPHYSEELAILFPNFMLKLEDERWNETFHAVIYWGARSNNTSGSGIDTGIILTQIAIERLAYEFSLESQEKTESYCKLTRASDKFRFLFSHLEIPQEIPNNFVKIKELAIQEGFIDAPHFLTELRNSMVHPDNKRRQLFHGLYPFAWRLGMWYLELAILKLCSYEGTYANRLTDERWIGQVEQVPWSKI